jgi:CRISPR-associated endonuclease Cas1
VAKYYWHHYGTLLPSWVTFPGRHAQSDDVTNKLLDIGYHHLATNVRKILDEKDCITALGLLHVAQSSDATPLVYDLMELFRADIVDMSVATWLRQKKQPVTKLTQKHIAQLLHDMNERMDKRYYLADFGQCHSYRYYMEIQITKFIKAVNHNEVFLPLTLPMRHDTRCTCQPSHPML